MVTTFVDDNKVKRSLKKWIHTVSISSILFNFFLFVNSWRNNFLGLNPKGPYLSLEKEKENSCAVFTNSIKQVRKIKKFQVADLQQQLRNVPKNLVYVQSCCFANVNRWYYMAARRHEISLRVFNEERNFVSPSGLVMFYLLYKHQWYQVFARKLTWYFIGVYVINWFLFCRSCCRHCGCCLSSPLLWSRNVATMVKWHHTPLYWLSYHH